MFPDGENTRILDYWNETNNPRWLSRMRHWLGRYRFWIKLVAIVGFGLLLILPTAAFS
jgi:hypothetical protein